MPKILATGNEAIARAAELAGAELLFGYPITPATEIMKYWTNLMQTNPKLRFQQMEDEMASGFALIGAVLAGKKAFTATAGVGNVLMQDAFVLAEMYRLPTVAFINQRGGPSTGQVIYSQQEVNLTCFGGNSEGYRIVLSPSSVQELYDFALLAFNLAWKYRFPTFVLADGYLAKTKTMVKIHPSNATLTLQKSFATLQNKTATKPVYLKNTYNMEEEIYDININLQKAHAKMALEVENAEVQNLQGATTLIIAHGSVAGAVKEAIATLKKEGLKVALFRPITLNPFPKTALVAATSRITKILIAESSNGQLANLVKQALYGPNIQMVQLALPALAVTPDDIIAKIHKG